MDSSKLIAFNTLATAARNIVAALLAIFSSRWVLSALGATDYGLFNVVGALIVFVTLLNDTMAYSAARHFAYADGGSAAADVNHWFNCAVGAHLCLAAILIVIGWPVGEYVTAHVLNIPPDRTSACLWAFRISLAAAFASMITVPFGAMFAAKQRITELAILGMLQSIAMFVLAWSLPLFKGDRLLIYTTGMALTIIVGQLALAFRAMKTFEACHVSLIHCFCPQKLRAILSFATWSLIGSISLTLRNQGSAILLNSFFGPQINASYGIAGQVSLQTSQFSNAMLRAMEPEITSSEGRGARPRVLSLASRSSSFGTLLVLVFAIPLMLEMDYVLAVWLHKVPPQAAVFCRLLLLALLIDRLTIGEMMAIQARGKVAAYQLTVGLTLVLTLPLSFLFIKAGFEPSSVGIAFVITAVMSSLGRVLWARHLVGASILCWLKSVAWPNVAVALTSALAATLPHLLLPPSFLRLCLASALGGATTVIVGWFVAFDVADRQWATPKLREIMRSLGVFRTRPPVTSRPCEQECNL